MVERKNEIFPELFGTLEMGTDDKKWNIFHTKSRCEKKLANIAYKNNIEYYLPLVDSYRVYESKKAHFLKVLISGYFFTKCTLDEKNTLIKTGYTSNSLVVRNQEELVSDLKKIMNIRNINLPMEEAQFLFEGYLVEIIDGPLIGLIGLIKNIENPEKFIVQVNVIKKAVSITLSNNQFRLLRKIKKGEIIE